MYTSYTVLQSYYQVPKRQCLTHNSVRVLTFACELNSAENDTFTWSEVAAVELLSKMEHSIDEFLRYEDLHPEARVLGFADEAQVAIAITKQ